MQLLIEEFHNKLSKFLYSMKWTPLKVLARLLFYGIIITAVIWIIIKEYLIPLLVIALLWVIAEIAHWLRKSREEKIADVENEKKIKKELKQPVKNKNLLTKPKKQIIKLKQVKRKTIKQKAKIKSKNKNLLTK